MSDLLYRMLRKVTGSLSQRRFLGPGPGGAEKANLIIYFDYEREFGNLLGLVTASAGFRGTVDLLTSHGIRATWNCVGLIAEHYPDTLRELVSGRHELASHTYNHVDVTGLPREALVKELLKCRERFRSGFGADVVGLHPPRDRWSPRLPGLLNRLGYRYLIARDDNPAHWRAHYLKLPLGKEILSIASLGDDWGFIEKGCAADAMLEFWLERVSALRPGGVAAIGFHPWILGADPARMRAFASVLDAVAANDAIEVVTAREVLEWYED